MMISWSFSLVKGDAIGEGLLKEAASVVDPYFSMAIKNFLYSHKDKFNGFGGDLVAFNIQRGRDHGIPPYFAFLKYCFNFHAKNWNDLRLFIEDAAFRQLTAVYEYVLITKSINNNLSLSLSLSFFFLLFL